MPDCFITSREGFFFCSTDESTKVFMKSAKNLIPGDRIKVFKEGNIPSTITIIKTENFKEHKKEHLIKIIYDENLDKIVLSPANSLGDED